LSRQVIEIICNFLNNFDKMDKKNIIKNYTNGEITVKWQTGLCTHSRICFTGLIDVFNPRNRPWVNMSGATTERIIEQVNKCPSGALSWKYNNEEKMEELENKQTAAIEIELIPNGPVMVKAPVCIKSPTGEETTHSGPVFLCRCGESKNKPFCDGTHNATGFKG